jgi:hypothetical protein
MRDLIGFIITECVKHGVTVRMLPTEYHDDGGEDVSGTWDDEEKTLTIATKNKSWVEVLAHEFGHFQQWKARLFDDGIYEDVYGTSEFDDWLLGNKKLSPERVDEMTRAMQACELDAEKRAYKLLKKFKVKTDLERYVQKSNAYVLFYNVMAGHRQWCDKETPTRIDEIVDLMPTKFITDLEEMPDGFEQLVIDRCFKPKSRWRRFKEWLR